MNTNPTTLNEDNTVHHMSLTHESESGIEPVATLTNLLNTSPQLNNNTNPRYFSVLFADLEDFLARHQAPDISAGIKLYGYNAYLCGEDNRKPRRRRPTNKHRLQARSHRSSYIRAGTGSNTAI